MRVLNCMWSAETAYHSVHLVLSNFLDAIAPVTHESLFLMGDSTQQKIFSNAQSFRSNKRSTKKLIARYFLRKEIIFFPYIVAKAKDKINAKPKRNVMY